MTAARSRLAAMLLVAGTASSGCALEDGRGFGEVEARLAVGTERAPGRWDGTRLKTDGSWWVDLHEGSLTVHEVTLVSPAAGGGGEVFDPADPPPGYSLCHAGHCHSDDGALVSYDDIQAELDGAGAGGPRTFLSFPVEETFDLLAPPAWHTLEVCVPDCAVGRGEVSRIRVVLGALVLRATVTDASAQDRLDGGALELEVRLDPAGAPLEVALEPTLAFDRGAAPRVRLGLGVEVSAGVLDGLDFASLAENGRVILAGDWDSASPASGAVLENLLRSPLRVDLERTEW